MANIALRAARQGAQRIRRMVDRPDLFKITEKARFDYATNVDREVEADIVRNISRAYSEHHFICEESGESGEPDSDFTWLIDPIDGTRNFILGIPHLCISIACLHRGRLEHAVIIDPLRDEEFVASRGQGAQVNDRRARVEEQRELAGTVLATEAPDKPFVNAHFQLLAELQTAEASVRQTGSAALDLAYVAAGRLHGGFFTGLQDWDMAAGVLLIREAGGMVSGLDGDADSFRSGDLFCTSPKLSRELAPLIQRTLGQVKRQT